MDCYSINLNYFARTPGYHIRDVQSLQFIGIAIHYRPHRVIVLYKICLLYYIYNIN